MPQRRVRYFVFFLIATALAVALFFVRAQPVATNPERTRPGASGASPVFRSQRLAGVVGPRAWEVGTRRRFSLEHEATVERANVEAGSRRVRIHGELAVTTAAVTDEAIRLELRLDTGLVEPSTAVARPADLDRPFMVELDWKGTLASLRFEAGVGRDAQRYLATIAAAIQLTTPGGKRWEVLERDTTGEYLALYEQRGTTIERSCETYERLFTGEGLQSTASLGAFATRGGTRFELDAMGHPVSVEREQQFELDSPRLGIQASSRRTTRLQRIALDTATVDTHWDALLAAELGARGRSGEGQSMKDRQIIGAHDFASLLAEAYRAAALDEQQARDLAGEVGYRLGALVRLQPEVAAQLEAELANAADDLNHFTEAALIGGLGHAGSNASRAALAGLLEEGEIPERRRVGVIVALNQQETTSPDAARAMLAQLDSTNTDVASQAMLALGSMNRTLEGSGDGQGELDPVASLLDAWRTADSTHQREVVLDALGNSADPRALPILEQVLAEPEVGLHRAAIFALRGLPGERPIALLLAFLEPAPPALQLAALAAVRHRERDFARFHAAIEALRATTDNERVAGEAAALLEAHAGA